MSPAGGAPARLPTTPLSMLTKCLAGVNTCWPPAWWAGHPPDSRDRSAPWYHPGMKTPREKYVSEEDEAKVMEAVTRFEFLMANIARGPRNILDGNASEADAIAPMLISRLLRPGRNPLSVAELVWERYAPVIERAAAIEKGYRQARSAYVDQLMEVLAGALTECDGAPV